MKIIDEDIYRPFEYAKYKAERDKINHLQRRRDAGTKPDGRKVPRKPKKGALAEVWFDIFRANELLHPLDKLTDMEINLLMVQIFPHKHPRFYRGVWIYRWRYNKGLLALKERQPPPPPGAEAWRYTRVPYSFCPEYATPKDIKGWTRWMYHLEKMLTDKICSSITADQRAYDMSLESIDSIFARFPGKSPRSADDVLLPGRVVRCRAGGSAVEVVYEDSPGKATPPAKIEHPQLTMRGYEASVRQECAYELLRLPDGREVIVPNRTFDRAVRSSLTRYVAEAEKAAAANWKAWNATGDPPKLPVWLYKIIERGFDSARHVYESEHR